MLSIETCYRINENEQNGLPKIHAQVIGYGLAEKLLQLIDNETTSTVPQKWKGDLKVNYTLGGKLKNDQKITLNIFNKPKISKIYNVIGTIKGSIEPG
jgi:N-acetylated-alpha-linked acidic dipeptidase